MIEKLLESWLDSASERSYQATFVQMLGAQGYRVLHSTRHCSLEFGKDVLAIAPDGVACAFQLKGHPGGRLGLNEFRADVQPQLIQLMSQPIVFPGLDATTHRSYLVSNGYFEEEVHRAIDDLNRGPYPFKASLMGRGQLLEWATDLGAALWPSEMKNVRELLELFLHDGRDLLPLAHLASMLEEILHLRPNDTPLKRAEMLRAAPSAALLTGIATRQFASAENHFALASAWCLLAVSLVAAGDRSNMGLTGTAKESLLLAEEAIRDSLVALFNEVASRPHLVEGNGFTDPEFYRWRYTLLCGLFGALWFFPAETPEDRLRRNEIATWLNQKHKYLELWGEAAVPCLLSLIFTLRRTDAGIGPDLELAGLLKHLVDANQNDGKNALPDPYYGFEHVARARYGLRASNESSGLQEETFAGSSYTAELIMHLVARARLKTPCRVNWPNFNRLGHKRFVPAERWHFCQLEAAGGIEETRQYPPEYRWETLCADASAESCQYVPPELVSRPHLLLLWVILTPQRLTSDVGRLLSAALPWRKWEENR